MRLLDTYALYTGSKIDKPFIYEKYFPLPIEKFITFQAQTPYESRNYNYWQDVINMIAPILLKNDIRIIQTGLTKEQPYNQIVDLRGQTSLQQMAYLMKRSMLHFGPDSFGVHLASHYDIPVVSLYSISMPEVAGPHFGSKEKQILFKAYERVGNKKPSYSPTEDPKSINSIKPEEIAAAILKLLNIDFPIPFVTAHIGKKYSQNVIREVVANHPGTLSNPEIPVEIRLDLPYDQNILGHLLSYYQKAVVVTDKRLNIDFLKNFKTHIPMVVYRVTENSDHDFVKEIIDAGFQLLLVSDLTEEQLEGKKIHFYEFGGITKIEPPDKETVESLRKDIDKLYYQSCKLRAANGEVYRSNAAYDANIKIENDFDYEKVIDDPQFWKDLDFYHIVKKLD